MILPDVNILLYAFRRDAELHEVCAAWLAELVRGPEELALSETVLTGFVRIATNSRALAEPALGSEALAFVQRLRGARRARTVVASAATWAAFGVLLAEDPAARGNLVPDAWLAALAISHGAVLATHDRGMRRFAGLTVVDPVQTGRP